MPDVQLSPDATSDFDALPPAMKSRVRDVIARLGQWPEVSGAKPLRHNLKGSFRVRTGDYRVLFRVERNGAIVVIRIDNRRDVYRGR